MPSPTTNSPMLDAARRRARVSAEAVVSAYIHELAQPGHDVRAQRPFRTQRPFRVTGSHDGRRALRRRGAAHRNGSLVAATPRPLVPAASEVR